MKRVLGWRRRRENEKMRSRRGRETGTMRPLLVLAFTVLLFAEIRCGEGAEGEVEEQEEEEHRIGFLWEDKSYNQVEFVREVCHKDDLTAFYVIGKAYEMLVGPMPAKADRSLPFVEEVESHGTLWGGLEDGQAICEQALRNLRKEIAQFPIYKRWESLSSCAATALSEVARDTEGLDDHVRKLLSAAIASHLGHAYWQDAPFLCEVLKFPVVKKAMEPHLVFTPAPDSSSTCDAQSEGGGEAQGECHPGVKPPVSLVTDAHNGSIIMVPCTLADWRFCPDAKLHERQLATRAAQWGVSKAVASGQAAFEVQLTGTVRDAYRWVLGRDPSPEEVEHAGSKSVAHVAKLLRHSEEFTLKCSSGGCMALAERTIIYLFKEILLRPPDATALHNYALLLQNTGSKSEVQRALVMSEEYAGLCKARTLSCLQAKEDVIGAFQEVLGREVDIDGLISYARELILGHITIDRIKEDLRNSNEYKSRFGKKA